MPARIEGLASRACKVVRRKSGDAKGGCGLSKASQGMSEVFSLVECRLENYPRYGSSMSSAWTDDRNTWQLNSSWPPTVGHL